MKKAKQVLSILLAALMIALSMSAITATAANEKEITASGKCGDNITWEFKDGTLTVAGKGVIKPLTRIEYEEYTDYIYHEDGSCEEVTRTREKTVEYFPWGFDGTLGEVIWSSYGFNSGETYNIEEIDAAQLAEMLAGAVTSVQRIQIGEGIKSIPKNAFLDFCPLIISLPTTIETVENEAFDSSFLKDLFIYGQRTDFDRVNIKIPAYKGETCPFASLEERVNAELAVRAGAIFILDTWFNHNEYDGLTEEEFENLLVEKYNEIENIYGTTGEGVSDMKEFQLGKEVRAMDYVSDPNNPGYVTPGFVKVTPVKWVCVHAPEGSDAQSAAEAGGVKFEPLKNHEPTEGESDQPTEEANKAKENKTGIAAFFQKITDFFKNLINTIKSWFRF